MAIQARCPECNKAYHLADTMLGKTVRCKQCAQTFTVKAPRNSRPEEEAEERPTGIRAERAPSMATAGEDGAPQTRRPRDEDDGGPARRLRKPQKSGSRLTLWLILGGGGVLLLAGVLVLVLVLNRRSSSDPNIPDVDLGGRWPEPVNLRNQVDPDSYVRLQVAGVFNEYTREEVNQKAGKLAEGGPGNFTFGASEGNRMTIVIIPLRDVEGAAKRIDFGEVRSVSGRTITVVARKVEGPPAGADGLTRALFHMKMTTKKFRHQGLRELKDTPLDAQRRAEVAKALEEFIKTESELFPRAEAVEALGKWGTKENAPALLRALEDRERHVQSQAMRALAALKEPAAIEPIAERLERHWPDAGQALRSFGAPAEKALIKCMDSTSPRTRDLACEILKDIGTKECIPAMAKALANSSTRSHALQTLERLQAVEAADAIAACLGDFGARGEATRILRSFGPQGEQALIKCMDSPNQQAREAACEILRDSGTKACVPSMIKALSDRRIQRNALQALDRLKAVEAAEAVAGCMDDSGLRGEASRILKRFGPAAEKAVIKSLQSTDNGVRREACTILAEIGTRLCVPALFEAVRLDNNLQLAAQDALKRIQARGK
jgi:HEAT repeat protein